MALYRLNPGALDAPALALANTDDVLALGGKLAGVELIVLQFPKFTDGRAYSQARLLRERLGYAGGLRATGAVFLDQLPFLLRCGFEFLRERPERVRPGARPGLYLVQRRLPADRRSPGHRQCASPQASQSRRRLEIGHAGLPE